MPTDHDLRRTLQRIDGKGYKAYKDIGGSYDCGEYRLLVDHVQGDPFAAPSRVRVRLRDDVARFPRDTYRNRSREIALRDFLARRFAEAARRFCRGNRGTGHSGEIGIDRPGQEILERTAVVVDNGAVEARFTMALPAFGRSVAGRHASAMFFEELPAIVDASLRYPSLDSDALYAHVRAAEDADTLRGRLDELGLVAFVADGAVLPRASGIDPRPLRSGSVVPFAAAASLRVTVELPNAGTVSGMGVPRGVTLIVGGGYHGKSTLLSALELGIYNHVPGDGRELVVTSPAAVKIRAEDGRRVEQVDVSPFIDNLPYGRDTKGFSTDDASGSTSQAANIMEALEAGARVLLIDEDTSATNFMIRDHRMQRLVAKDREPITPFVDKVRQLERERGVSTILVMGGSGEYFDVADRVICMIDYLPHELTAEARAIAEQYRGERINEGGERFGELRRRVPEAHSFKPARGKRDVKIAAKGLHTILFGRSAIELDAVEQLVDISQTRAIGDAIHYAARYMDGEASLEQIVRAVVRDCAEKGLEALSGRPAGDYARFRELELAAAINRLRTVRMRQARAAD